MFSEEFLIRMGFDNSAVDRGLRSARQKADQAAQGIASSFKRYLGTIGAAFTVGGLISTFNSLRRFADDMTTRAATFGVTAEYLQRLSYAMEQSGINAESSDKAFKYLTARMNDYKDGLKEVQRTFEKLGINPSGMNTSEVIQQISTAFAEMKDPTERAAIAMELFGAKNADLVALLAKGQEEMKKLMEQADVLTDSQLQNIDRADKALKRLGVTAKVGAGTAVSDVMQGGEFTKQNWLSGLASGMTLGLGRMVVGAFYRDEFGGGAEESRGAKLDQQISDFNAKKEQERKAEERREEEKEKNFKAYSELVAMLNERELKAAKAATAELQKRAGLMASLNGALDTLNRSKSDARNFSLQELLGLNPDELSDSQYQQYMKAQDVSWLEEEAKYASLEGNAGYAKELQDRATKLRSQITGITEADKFPYGEQEKRAADALEKLINHVDNGGLPVYPMMGE